MPSPRTALLIEDDAAIASLMLELLRGMGFDPRHTPARTRAAEMMQDRAPDLIVTDLITGSSASEAWIDVERLRDRAAGTPVLIVTGHASALTEGPARGFPVLAKPFDLEEFEQAVRELFPGEG
jgi:DNA-binding NtrC family response regulator